MKSKISIAIVALAILLLSSTGTFAQKYSHSISANPIGLAFGILNATYEQQLSAINSFTVNGLYWSIVDWKAYGIGGTYRWYPKLFDDHKKPLEGFSVGPLVQIGFWSWNGWGTYSDYGGVSFSIGGEAAYKWVFGGFVVEPMLDITIPLAHPTGYSNLSAFGAGVNLGYAW